MSVARVAPAPLRPVHVAAASALALGVGLAVLGRLGFSAWHVVAAGAAVLLVWLAAIDLESRLIPDRLVLPAAATLLVVATGLDPVRGAEHAAAAVAAGGFLLLAAAVRPGALGMGDVKLGLLLGALLGTAVLGALVMGFGLVAAAGLVLVAHRGRAALEEKLPLAPFLAAGAIAALLLG